MKLSSLPWWAKILIKCGVALTPLSYERLRSLLIGYRGAMEAPQYAEDMFNKYLKDFRDFSAGECQGSLLELGPGGSLLNGVIGRSLGFERCILIDVDDFASRDVELYRKMIERLPLEVREKFQESLTDSGDIVEAFREIGVVYLTGGLASLRDIPDGSVTFSFSNAVLEHVHLDEFESTICELNRVHRKGSISSHQIDYKDHLDKSINNLRFSRKIWESRFFPNSGFYTNRLRHRDVSEVFVKVGFCIEKEDLVCWTEVPLASEKLVSEFQSYSDNELRISGARLVCRKRADAN